MSDLWRGRGYADWGFSRSALTLPLYRQIQTAISRITKEQRVQRSISFYLAHDCSPNRIKAFANLPEAGIRKRQRQQRSEDSIDGSGKAKT